MTPLDITIFQALAGIFTLCFILLIYFLWTFMRDLEEARIKLISLATRLEQGLDPILEDLQAGAAEFRAASEYARHSAEQLSDLGDQLGRLTSFTKTGAKGIWAILAQAAGAFMNK